MKLLNKYLRNNKKEIPSNKAYSINLIKMQNKSKFNLIFVQYQQQHAQLNKQE
jgi:hypothetical protein